jgi:hypothetical protein
MGRHHPVRTRWARQRLGVRPRQRRFPTAPADGKTVLAFRLSQNHLCPITTGMADTGNIKYSGNSGGGLDFQLRGHMDASDTPTGYCPKDLDTLTGYCLKAQGCEARATLGQHPKPLTTPTGLCQTS